MSAASELTDDVRFLIHQEARGPGDYEAAIDRLADQYRVSRWALDHLRKGKAKDPKVSLKNKIKLMLIDHCERKAKILLERAAIAQALGASNDDNIRDIADQIRALAARLEVAKGG